MTNGIGFAALRPTCLVIDDEPAILRLVAIVLRDMGCDTLSASNAAAALDLLKSETPDLIISDVKMPGIDGAEFARLVKADEKLSEIPILLMSAFGEPRGHTGDGFLAKPFDVDGLADFVAPYLPAEAA